MPKTTIAAVALACALAQAVMAQTYPTKPISLVVGNPPGGVVDVTARRFAELVGAALGQPIIVDNRNSQLVANAFVKNAKPDGYTLLVIAAGPNTVLPSMQPVDWDPIKDFTPITKLISTPLYLAVGADNPARSVTELVEWARKKPGGLTYGSTGVASPAHFSGELLQRETNAPMRHVPYKGIPQALVDVVAGRLDFTLTSYTAARPFLDDRLRFLAVYSETRSAALPDVPTMAEAGYPNMQQPAWLGLEGPRGLPTDIVAKLHAAFIQASKNPELIKALNQAGIELTVSPSPDDFGREIAVAVAQGAKLVKMLGLAAK